MKALAGFRPDYPRDAPQARWLACPDKFALSGPGLAITAYSSGSTRSPARHRQELSLDPLYDDAGHDLAARASLFQFRGQMAGPLAAGRGRCDRACGRRRPGADQSMERALL